jgi:hypothetical protein
MADKMARRRTTPRPARRPAKRRAPSEGPSSSARGNWIDDVDRVARRPFLEGDYLPSKGARKRPRP